MDCVYICRPGENEELKYSIRSVDKNLSHDRIWIIGYKPNWYTGNYVEVEDKSVKLENIRNCLSVVTKVGAISDDFVLMNDDFYILKPMGTLPTYHGGFLDDKISRYVAHSGSTRYTRVLGEASRDLKKRGIKQPLDYDIHTPMIMNKLKLKEIVGMNMAPRSTYGNIFNIGGTQIEDVKIYKYNNTVDMSPGVLSTEDNSLKLVKEMLEKEFSEPTRYELSI